MEGLREKLVEAYKRDDFFKVIYDLYFELKDERKLIGKEIASLHNNNLIDAVAAFRQLSKGLKGTNFFLIRNIFEDALPEINASVVSVMDCVEHLVAEAGNNLAVGTIFTPFIKFCEAQVNRPEEVLQTIEGSSGKWLDFISPAIVAGSNLELSKYVSVAIALTRNDNLQVRVRAVFALGKIDYRKNRPLLTDALRALENVIQSEDNDQLLGTGLKSAFSLYVADNILENDVVKITKVALASKGDFALHTASELFGLNSDKIPSAFLEVLLDALKRTNPQNKGTLNNIDFGLQHLIKTNQEEKAISLLEYLLVQNNGDLCIEVFDSLTHDLYGSNHPMLNQLATRWLLSKKTPLCRAVMDIVGLGHEEDIILTADKHQIEGQPEGTCLFAARKTIGWLFTNPVSCSSFIVSLIDVSSNEEIEQITDLLFDPLLISYAGKVKDYLESILPSQSEKGREVLTNSLAKLEEYQAGIKKAWEIHELLPSQAQRETHLRLFNRQFANSYKEAQKNSIINLIASKSILLYGRKSISYVHYPNAQTNRMEMALQSFGHSIEFPRLEYMDPHGLDYILRIFRVEGCER